VTGADGNEYHYADGKRVSQSSPSQDERGHAENMFAAKGFVPKDVIDAHPDLAVKHGYAKPKKAAEPSITTLPPKEFAAKVQAVADEYPHGFYDNKVFISDLFDHFHKSDPTLTLDAFKGSLRKASIAGDLHLSAANEVQKMHPEDVRRSDVTHPYNANQTIANFVLTPPNATRTNRYTQAQIDAARNAELEAHRNRGKKP